MVFILAVTVLAAASLGAWFFLPENGQPPEKSKPVPSVSIGCDRVLWKGTELELAAATNNIKNPSFEWQVDGNAAGTSQKLRQKFDIGEHQVVLNVVFDSGTLNAKRSIIVIDKVEGVTLHGSAASRNQWGFQTLYRGKDSGVKGATIAVDSLPAAEVNSCGSLTTKALSAGQHSWKAQYQGKTIASGTFNLKAVSELKLSRIEVAASYTAGSTVSGKIVLKNTGSTPVTGFDIRTVAVNNNYAWMGDAAKKEYSDHYTSDIKPGETYEIPIRVTIPEKVSGIRPSGKYTITVTLMLNGQAVDAKSVNTVVK